MDISVCDDDSLMMIEPQSPAPKEDVLACRDEELYNSSEYSQDIYDYGRDAEVTFFKFTVL